MDQDCVITVGVLVKPARSFARDWNRDREKERRFGIRFFMGRAAAYLSNRPYKVVEIKPNGGLVLEGFLRVVSPKDVALVAA